MWGSASGSDANGTSNRSGWRADAIDRCQEAAISGRTGRVHLPSGQELVQRMAEVRQGSCRLGPPKIPIPKNRANDSPEGAQETVTRIPSDLGHARTGARL